MGVDEELEVKLPLMSRSVVLDPLPGQDPTVEYGIIWDACQQPGEGLGYVVRFVDSRTCRILAWMGRGGVVSECDRPIAFVMPGIPVLATLRPSEESEIGSVRVRRHGSDELVQAAAFRDYFPNQVGFEPVAGKGAEGAATRADLERALGPYAERKLGWRVFVAVSYLAFYLLPRLSSEVGHAKGTISDVLKSLMTRPLPDAIDSLIFRVITAEDNPADEVSGFERYAARMLQQAGASELRDIAARRDIGIARLATTHLFWMRIADDVEPAEREVLIAIESCLNRMALIDLALKAADASTRLSDCRESRCALEDHRTLVRVADRAQLALDAGQDENPYATYYPANTMRGGEWDVRTRFIRACENLPLPFRLEYRFDCHARGGMLEARIGLPPARAFPEDRWNPSESRWERRANERPAMAACYALRVAALVAACGFGASIAMRQVVVTGCAGSPAGQPLLSLRFERMSFLNRALYRIESGMVARVGERGACTADNVKALLDMLAPLEANLDLADDATMQPVDPLHVDLPESRLPISEDRRYLPSSLAHLLHADRVCDLDLESNSDLRELDAVQTAVEESRESSLLGIATLEEIVERHPIAGLADPGDIVAAAEAALRGLDLGIPGYDKLDDEGDSRPVRLAYFPNLFSRCLVDVVARREDEGFEPVPSQAYLARQALAKLYLRSGDADAAMARIAECAALTPTSSGMLLEAAQIALAAQRPQDAVELIIRALRVCVRQPVANALYAHLAGAYWACGKLELALASFAMARRFEQGQSGFDQAIGQLVNMLRLDDMPSAEAAAATLRGAGVPLAPVDEARRAILVCAAEFTDARMFELAWPLVGSIGIDVGNDVIAMMGEHLHTGLG